MRPFSTIGSYQSFLLIFFKFFLYTLVTYREHIFGMCGKKSGIACINNLPFRIFTTRNTMVVMFWIQNNALPCFKCFIQFDKTFLAIKESILWIYFSAAVTSASKHHCSPFLADSYCLFWSGHVGGDAHIAPRLRKGHRRKVSQLSLVIKLV